MNGFPKNVPRATLLALLCVVPLFGIGDGVSAVTTATNKPSIVQALPASTASPSPPAPVAPAMPTTTNKPPSAMGTNSNFYALIVHELPEIHGKIALPKEWTLLPGKLLEGDVLLATREKIEKENDPWITGLSMTIDRNGAKDSGQKASVYAQAMAEEAREKAGDDASPLTQSQSGAFREFRFEFPVMGDQSLLFTEVLRSNDDTGTVATIVWQAPAGEAANLKELREAILSSLVLDPSQ